MSSFERLLSAKSSTTRFRGRIEEITKERLYYNTLWDVVQVKREEKQKEKDQILSICITVDSEGRATASDDNSTRN